MGESPCRSENPADSCVPRRRGVTGTEQEGARMGPQRSFEGNGMKTRGEGSLLTLPRVTKTPEVSCCVVLVLRIEKRTLNPGEKGKEKDSGERNIEDEVILEPTEE